MMTEKSIFHVNQGGGTCDSKSEVAGYYNDLTEKVIRDDPNILVPKYHVDTGEEIYFSIGVSQYGLAAYTKMYGAMHIVSLVGCLLIGFDVPYVYVFYFASCVVIIMLNYKDIGNICVSLSTMLKRIIKKKKYK